MNKGRKMKKLLITIITILAFVGCNPQEGGGNQGQKGQQGMGDPAAIVAQYPVYDLTEEQRQDLAFMWEEEKLARDVYNHFVARYGDQTFSNISRAEQKHMDATGAILDKYSIARGVDPNDIGHFSFPELDNMYFELTQRGEVSLYEAYKVGKDIEVLDIADLKSKIETAHPDAADVFNRLLNGSYKHLEAFESKL